MASEHLSTCLKRLKSVYPADPKTLSYARRCCKHAKRRGFFDAHRKWLSELYYKEIELGIIRNVEIRPVPGFGHGAFATAPFQPGDYVGTYAGVLVRRKLFGRNSNDYCFRIPTTRYTPWPLMIDAEKAGNEMRYVNHSDTPNLDSIAIEHKGLIHILLCAAKPIPKNAQLLLDYGHSYWKSRKKKELN